MNSEIHKPPERQQSRTSKGHKRQFLHSKAERGAASPPLPSRGLAAIRRPESAATAQTFGLQSTDYSPSGYAVSAINVATTGNAYGVYGESQSTTIGRGVYGKESGAANTGYAGYFNNTATSGVNHGVYGKNASTSGYGGYFTNTGAGAGYGGL